MFEFANLSEVVGDNYKRIHEAIFIVGVRDLLTIIDPKNFGVGR